MAKKSMIIVDTPKSCIECDMADQIGYCRLLKDRKADYALKRHDNCPMVPIKEDTGGSHETN